MWDILSILCSGIVGVILGVYLSNRIAIKNIKIIKLEKIIGIIIDIKTSLNKINQRDCVNITSLTDEILSKLKYCEVLVMLYIDKLDGFTEAFKNIEDSGGGLLMREPKKLTETKEALSLAEKSVIKKILSMLVWYKI